MVAEVGVEPTCPVNDDRALDVGVENQLLTYLQPIQVERISIFE